jgi:hypothetical protein
VTPLVLAAAGVVALIAAGLTLRSFGSRYRVGRLLATTPKVTVGEAVEMARAGQRAYVRVDGRIDTEEDFEGPDHQPLVLRRVRLEVRDGRRWRPFEDHRQVVPFTVNEGLDTIAIDTDALDAGLVVVPRESIGTAADLADRVPPGTAAETPVRARIDQLSSVEHAIVLGYPVPPNPGVPAGAGDAPPPGAPAARMTAGRSRPLILTVLEPDEAMRVLAADGRSRTRVAGALIAVAVALILGSAAWAVLGVIAPTAIGRLAGLDTLIASALAASPEPSAITGDPRSNGQGPGLVGTPGLAILGVALIGILAVVATTIYVRLTASSNAARTHEKPAPDKAGGRPTNRP